MKRWVVLAIIAAPARAEELPAFTVQFRSPFDDVAPALVCARKGPTGLECMDLRLFLEAHDQAVKAQEELERRRRQQQTAWTPGIEL